MRQADVGDVGAPDLVRALDLDPAQQVGIDRMLRVGRLVFGPGAMPANPRIAHQPLHALAVHRVALRLQKDHHAPTAVERVTGVLSSINSKSTGPTRATSSLVAA
jgi:hypothetical protein